MASDSASDPALAAKLDRLVALRGDPAKGLPAKAWADNLDGVDRTLLLRAAIEAVRKLVIPDWAALRPDDKRPQQALDAAEAWLAAPGEETLKQAKAAAKECTAARNETFGTAHHAPQAARDVAWAVGDDDSAHLHDALASIEEGLRARIALTSEYERGPEMRRNLVETLRRVLLPPVKAAPAATGPVTYSPTIRVEVGQQVLHKVFGETVVTAVGETFVEVQLGDGSKKRLALKR